MNENYDSDETFYEDICEKTEQDEWFEDDSYERSQDMQEYYR